MLDLAQDDQPTSPAILVLAKQTAARFNQDWHYHFANAAGRARCGASLNLREWHVREMSNVPTGLCARCARLLGPSHPQAVNLRIRATSDETQSDQLILPLE